MPTSVAPLREGAQAFESAAGWVLTAANRFIAYLQSLTWTEIAINIGVSAALLIAVFVCLWILAWLGGRKRRGVTLPTARLPAPTTLRLAGVALTVYAAYALLAIWGLDVFALAGAPHLFPIIVRVVLIALFGLAMFEAASRFVTQRILHEAERADDLRRAAQLRSLGPLAGGVIRIIVAIFAVLLILSQFDIDIGPLIAGAGIVSVAVGFGAQTLVKDYLTGFMLILEDIAAIGDIVKIGDSSGVVERMTLRTIRLRNFNGTLHVIPYSEAQIVHNMTKTFSYYVFDLAVSYGADIDRALDIMKETGDAMRADPAFADLMLDSIEVFGVDQLGDSGIILKARIKTPPGKQWVVGREYNRRIKQAFDAAGIEIPFPHLKVLMEAPGAEAPS
jgi:small conductance mechanosensitive channel